MSRPKPGSRNKQRNFCPCPIFCSPSPCLLSCASWHVPIKSSFMRFCSKLQHKRCKNLLVTQSLSAAPSVFWVCCIPGRLTCAIIRMSTIWCPAAAYLAIKRNGCLHRTSSFFRFRRSRPYFGPSFAMPSNKPRCLKKFRLVSGTKTGSCTAMAARQIRGRFSFRF